MHIKSVYLLAELYARPVKMIHQGVAVASSILSMLMSPKSNHQYLFTRAEGHSLFRLAIQSLSGLVASRKTMNHSVGVVRVKTLSALILTSSRLPVDHQSWTIET